MGIFSMFFENKDGVLIDAASGLYSAKLAQLSAKELAVEKCVDLISKTISRLEFKVFKFDSKSKKINSVTDDIYYRLNIRPNDNADGTTFWKDVVRKLIKENEALVIILNSKMYLAETFDKTDEVIFAKKFKNIYVKTLNGDNLFKMTRSFSMDEVFYFSLGNSQITRMLDVFMNEYSKLIAFAAFDYKFKNGKKFRIKFPGGGGTQIRSKETGEKTYSASEYIQIIANDLFSDDPAILNIPGNIEINNLITDSAKTSEDYRKLIDGAFNYVASTFNIPVDIMLGNKTDKSTSNVDMITNAIMPFLEIIEDGINAKISTKEEYISGSKVRIDRTKILHTSIIDISKDSEALFRIGFSHNDIREIGGLEPINEEWANEHYITKNYTKEKGGEEK